MPEQNPVKPSPPVLQPTLEVAADAAGLVIPKWVEKAWGGELWFANDEANKYCGKKLFIIGGKKNSWHYHKTKDEVFLVDSGRMQLIFSPMNRALTLQDDLGLAERITLHPGQAFRVPAGMRHQMVGIETCWLIEASTVDLPGDTVRLIKGD